MKVTFLIGAAGSGKTYTCLEEIKNELKASPEGLPLIFLAPKQFTFQLERQILSDPQIKGYTRLFIFSYERLADYIISNFAPSSYNILSEEGRVMVLRSILSKIEPDLKAYGKSAKYPGFSTQLSQVLRELQTFGMSAEKLKKGGQNPRLPQVLKDKLEDLSSILENYQRWLTEHKLFDTSRLLEVAVEVLSKNPNLKIGGLWLDGFATLSELEIELLARLLPKCEKATLAFCVDADSYNTSKWLGKGFTVGMFFSKCKGRIEAEGKCEVDVKILRSDKTRFKTQPVLAYLEKHWGDFSNQGYEGALAENESCWWRDGGIRMVSCSNQLAEVIFAAREIKKFVRSGGRYREVAVLMRNLDDYHDIIRRIFYNYEIPFFLDRRESVSHHPVAELIRYGLRLVAFNWQREDLFGALKLGFAPASDSEIDWLENEALANGWTGKIWQLPLLTASGEGSQDGKRLDELLKRVFDPLVKFEKNLIETGDEKTFKPSAIQVANAIRELFLDWKVEERLNRWRDEIVKSNFRSYLPPSMHQTVLEELNELLRNFEMAFGNERKEIAEWIQILESGLCGLTVGVIPPSLDQVLIGAIDRSRNPELKLVIVIGLNEDVFPKAPRFSPILNEIEREILASENIYHGLSTQMLLALEWYFGYIACTRPSMYLILTYPTADWRGRPLNPSPFLTHIQMMFPKIELEYFSGVPNWLYAEHPYELSGLLASGRLEKFANALTSIENLISRFSQRWKNEDSQNILSEIVGTIFGDSLKISVSGLEDYAACPFKFFVRYVLRAEERILYEIDPRHIGAFQHLVLEEFHRTLVEKNKRWRDLTPDEAETVLTRIAQKLIDEYNNKLFASNPANLFQARLIVQRLKEFIRVNVDWLRESYKFDPAFVEIGFGLEESPLPAVEIPVDENRKVLICGRIDRIDAFFDHNEILPCVIVDYKSSGKEIDPILLASGIQLQLPLYLLVLKKVGRLPQIPSEKKIVPVGVFYVNLRGDFKSAKNRKELFENIEQATKLAYQYHGRFSASYLNLLDSRPDGENSGQFNYRITNSGELYENSVEGMRSEEFESLVSEIEKFVKNYGKSIFDGRFSIDPWKKKNGETACDNCDYSAICRIDPLSHSWRIVKCARQT